ncbi:hypothetical protein BGW38_010049 [Lunasporangiospora selenospora]|uniref:Uncharacterized protein n=1 Tax=Lunasporangiospora selenospora TaxID=979761 RepID=A0A9P6KHU2_9FUNG|nr:hypothetical protein BGW38_010049 [Lunasporangiospora selenospora]
MSGRITGVKSVPFWKNPEHRVPTLGLYRDLLRICLRLPKTYNDQPGRRRRPIPGNGKGPPGSAAALPSIERPYLFQWIRDCFRTNRYCTSPRITAGYLLEAENAYKKLRLAKEGDEEIRNELKDMMNGRTGRLRDTIEHLRELIAWDPEEITQRSRFFRLKRAQECVWDTRTRASIAKDPDIYYRIPLKPSLFKFPKDLDYYPPSKYPNQLKNQLGKYKNSGGVFLTQVTTSEGSRFPRIRGGTQPTWLSMMLKHRVESSVRRVNEWKELEEYKAMMTVEEKMMNDLGVDDVGYVNTITEQLGRVKSAHAVRRGLPSRLDEIE